MLAYRCDLNHTSFASPAAILPFMQLSVEEKITYIARIAQENCHCGQPGLKTIVISSNGSHRNICLCLNHYIDEWTRSAELRSLDPVMPGE